MTQIKKYTFEGITQLYSDNNENIFDGCMVMYHTIYPEEKHLPFQVEAYGFLFCIEGELNILSNSGLHVMKSDSLLIQLPNHILKIESQKKCTVAGLVMTPNYLRKNFLHWNKLFPLFIQKSHTPIVSIPKEKKNELVRMLGNIQERMKTVLLSEWTKAAYHAALETFFYDIISLASNPESPETENVPRNRKQDYFSRFIQLASQYCKKERKVCFYASKLCVTSKYLSTVIKEVSGKTPSNWIDEILITEAIFLLKFSNATIQEIAFQMNFPNPSFFGKFFKRYTGFSPKYYRTQDILTTS